MKWAFSDGYLSKPLWIHTKKSMKKLKQANSLILLVKLALRCYGQLRKLNREFYSKLSNTLPYPEGYHVKAYVLSFPKMWYFLGLTVFKQGVIGPQSKVKFRKKKLSKNVKKRHGHNFIFFSSETNSTASSHSWKAVLFVSDRKNQNCGRFFFLHCLFTGTHPLLLPSADFEQQ